MDKRFTRRRFVQGAAALAASVAIPIKLPDATEAQTLVESQPVEEAFEWLPAEEPLEFDFGPSDPVQVIGDYKPLNTEAPVHFFNERGELIGVSWYASLESFMDSIDYTSFHDRHRRYVHTAPEYRFTFHSEFGFDPLEIATVLMQGEHQAISGRFIALAWNFTSGDMKWPLECSGYLHDIMVGA